MSPRRAFPDTRERRRLELVRAAAPTGAVEWAILKDALRRPLAASERECILDLVGLHATFIAQARSSRVTSRDIKRTLGALAGMTPREAARAYASADDWTRTHLAAALRRAGIRDEEALAHPDGDQVVSAAKSAIASIAERAGRSPDHAEFARAILTLWREFGGAEWSPSARDDFGTPIVRFAAAIFRAAGASPSDLPAVAARLRSAA